MSDLSALEPRQVFHFFREICAIPHGSGNTKAISDYLVAFAKERSLSCIQDKLNNVLIFAPASQGYEDHPPVIVQGHMDMVCAKDPDSTHDFETDGLELRTDGKFLYANGTTLGGDDGIAVAYALALLDSKDIPHPPLEVVITVDEETGMYGAAGVDLSMLKGRMLLNIDSEEEGIFTVACAGGCRSTLRLSLERRAVYGPCIELRIEGLRGGHSGMEINRNRCNANKAMGELLSRIQEKVRLCLTSLTGGSADNAISFSARAKAVAMSMDLEPINEIVEQFQAEIRREYDEPNAQIIASNVDALGGNALTAQSTSQVVALLCAAPNGVQAMCAAMPELVQTSLNLGVMAIEGDWLRLTFSVRSSVNEEKQALLEKLRQLAQFHGAQYSQTGDYPAWEYKEDSVLRPVLVEVYREMFRKEPQVVSIHAGLECGLLGEKLPGLDSVSLGPNMYDIHTSREKLDIASAQRTWEFLLAVLKKL